MSIGSSALIKIEALAAYVVYRGDGSKEDSMVDDELRVIHTEKGERGKNPLEQVMGEITELFGKRGGGGGNGGQPPRKGQTNPFKNAMIFGGLLVLLILGMTTWYKIDVHEEGVITRFGKYDRTVGSGLHFKLPFGVERVVKVESKRVLQEEFGFRTKDSSGFRSTYEKQPYKGESLMLTGDLNIADVEWIVQYKISDPWKYLFHTRDVRRNIRDVSMSIMRRVVGDRFVTDVLTTQKTEIAAEAKDLTQQVLDTYDMGIRIESVLLQDVFPPERVKPAFNEVNAAKQEQEQTINNAERQYNKIIPEARGKAEKLLSDAEAYSIDTINRAKGDAAQFDAVMKAYRNAPEITRTRIYLDTMEEVFSKVDKFTVVDSKMKGILPLYTLAPPTEKK
jgi:modulator of FtsH protease HflK